MLLWREFQIDLVFCSVDITLTVGEEYFSFGFELTRMLCERRWEMRIVLVWIKVNCTIQHLKAFPDIVQEFLSIYYWIYLLKWEGHGVYFEKIEKARFSYILFISCNVILYLKLWYFTSYSIHINHKLDWFQISKSYIVPDVTKSKLNLSETSFP